MQELFNESVGEVLEVLYSEYTEFSEEDVATEATEKAEEIVDAIDEAKEMTEDEYNETLEVIATALFNSVMANIQFTYAEEFTQSLFTGEGTMAKVKKHLGANKRWYIDGAAGVAGAGAGAYIARRRAKKQGIS